MRTHLVAQLMQIKYTEIIKNPQTMANKPWELRLYHESSMNAYHKTFKLMGLFQSFWRGRFGWEALPPILLPQSLDGSCGWRVEGVQCRTQCSWVPGAISAASSRFPIHWTQASEKWWFRLTFLLGARMLWFTLRKKIFTVSKRRQGQAVTLVLSTLSEYLANSRHIRTNGVHLKARSWRRTASACSAHTLLRI